LEPQIVATKLDKWDNAISEYGLDQAFGAAIEAANQGWDHPWIVHVLRRPWQP
jgi:hypothetical protein